MPGKLDVIIEECDEIVEITVTGEGIPGPQGPQGERGEVGPQGPHGETGPQGEQGIQGPKGDKGDTGDTGPQGPIGDTGPQGEQGIQGETGPQGPIGETGPQGEQGPQGIQGEQGPKGDQGDPGGGVETIVAGIGINVDDSDPNNPVVNATPVPAAQVKQLYESNPDTNAFTDADVIALAGIQPQIDDINLLIGDVASALDSINGEVI